MIKFLKTQAKDFTDIHNFLLLILIPPHMILSGYVIFKIWNLLTFLPAITLVQAIILDLLINFLVAPHVPKTRTMSEVLDNVLLKPLVYYSLVLIVLKVAAKFGA